MRGRAANANEGMTTLALFIGAGGVTECCGRFRLSSPSRARFRNMPDLSRHRPRILSECLTFGNEKRLPGVGMNLSTGAWTLVAAGLESLEAVFDTMS